MISHIWGYEENNIWFFFAPNYSFNGETYLVLRPRQARGKMYDIVNFCRDLVTKGLNQWTEVAKLQAL